MNEPARLEMIVDYCLAARQLALAGDDEMLSKLLDMVLLAAGNSLMAAQERVVTPFPSRHPGGRSAPLVTKAAAVSKRRG